MELYNILLKNNINFIQVCFRWFNLFFCQEFQISDILRLWDSFFCDNDRFFFFFFFGVAVMKIKKNKIVGKDMYGIIQELGNLKINNIQEVIDIAIEIKNKYQNKILSIIKSKK